MFPNLNLPKYDFNLKRIEGIPYIFDIVRKKHVIVTPEEWVRQHLLHFLIFEKGYPQALISVEKGLTYNGMNKRTDIVCYDQLAKAILLVECKSASVALNQAVFEQIARYNFDLKVPHLLVSNGMEHLCCEMDYQKQNYNFITDIPNFVK